MSQQTPQDLENKSFFSNHLKTIMKEKGIKQIDLHNALGIPKSSLSGYLKGTALPNPNTSKLIAKYLNVPEFLLDLRFTNSITLNTLYDDFHSAKEQEVSNFINTAVIESLNRIINMQAPNTEFRRAQRIIDRVLESHIINPKLFNYDFDHNDSEFDRLKRRRNYSKEYIAKLIVQKYTDLLNQPNLENLCYENTQKLVNLVDELNSREEFNLLFLIDISHYLEEIAVMDKTILSFLLREKLTDFKQIINDVVTKPEAKNKLQFTTVDRKLTDKSALIDTIDYEFYNDLQDDFSTISTKIKQYFDTLK